MKRLNLNNYLSNSHLNSNFMLLICFYYNYVFDFIKEYHIMINNNECKLFNNKNLN